MLPLWYSVLGWCFSTVTITGNGLVIYMIVSTSRLHTKTNGFVLSLAVADLFVGVSYFMTEEICYKLNCDYFLLYAIGSFLSAASATNLCLLLVDRYITIVKPLRYATLMTTRTVRVLTAAAWGISFFAHLAFVLSQVMLYPRPDDYNFLVFDFVVFEIFPLVVSSFVTGHILVIARRNSRRISGLVAQLRFNSREDLQGKIQKDREGRRLATLVAVAGSVFFICYLNEVFYTVYYQLLGRRDDVLRYTTWLLNITNSAANPIAYAVFKRDIKLRLKRMLRLRRNTRSVHREPPLDATSTL